MIVSIARVGPREWEVWLYLTRPEKAEADADSADVYKPSYARCMLRSRDMDAVLDLVAGILETWH